MDIVSIIIGFNVQKNGGKFIVVAPEAHKFVGKIENGKILKRRSRNVLRTNEHHFPFVCSNYFWPNFAVKLEKLWKKREIPKMEKRKEKAEEACGSGFVIYLINGKYIAIAMLKTRNSKL